VRMVMSVVMVVASLLLQFDARSARCQKLAAEVFREGRPERNTRWAILLPAAPIEVACRGC